MTLFMTNRDMLFEINTDLVNMTLCKLCSTEDDIVMSSLLYLFCQKNGPLTKDTPLDDHLNLGLRCLHEGKGITKVLCTTKPFNWQNGVFYWRQVHLYNIPRKLARRWRSAICKSVT